MQLNVRLLRNELYVNINMLILGRICPSSPSPPCASKSLSGCTLLCRLWPGRTPRTWHCQGIALYLKVTPWSWNQFYWFKEQGGILGLWLEFRPSDVTLQKRCCHLSGKSSVELNNSQSCLCFSIVLPKVWFAWSASMEHTTTLPFGQTHMWEVTAWNLNFIFASWQFCHSSCVRCSLLGV